MLVSPPIGALSSPVLTTPVHMRVLSTQAFLTDVDVTTAQDVRHGDDQQVCCGVEALSALACGL